jgi:integrase
VQRALNAIARQHDLTHATFAHTKNLLSGIFKFAKQQGHYDGVNPCVDVAIPKGREGEETYAYSLEETLEIISRLPEPASTVVATAAFTGLRRGEIRGLQWEGYNGPELRVTRSIFNGAITPPKTKKSRGAVPVIAPLRAMFDAYRMTQGDPTSGPIFTNNAGRPLDLNNLLYRVIIPTLHQCSVCQKSLGEHNQRTGHDFVLDTSRTIWHGWHAFRRGLATNLNRLGVPLKTIQAILRHANLSTTANIYVKSVDEDSVKAMQQLENVLFSKCSVNPEVSLQPIPSKLLN